MTDSNSEFVGESCVVRTSSEHVHALNVEYLSTTLRRHVTLCSVIRVSVEHVASWSFTHDHVTPVR